MANFTAIKKEQHQNLKVSDKRGLEHIANQHLIATNAKEYSQLAINFPLFFIKEADIYRSVALLGLESGENLFFQNDRFNALTIPQSLALSPFSLGLDPDKENTLTACVDIDSPYVGEDKEIALFDAEGNESDIFKSIQDSLGNLYDNEVMTEKFIQELVDNELLQEFELLINLASGENKRLVGLYGVDEKKIAELSEEKIIDFHKRGLFIPIHSTMVSRGQVNRLVQLRNEHTDKKVAAIKLQPRTAD